VEVFLTIFANFLTLKTFSITSNRGYFPCSEGNERGSKGKRKREIEGWRERKRWIK